MLGGVMRLLGGAFLVTPGVITDAVGLLHDLEDLARVLFGQLARLDRLLDLAFDRVILRLARIDVLAVRDRVRQDNRHARVGFRVARSLR